MLKAEREAIKQIVNWVMESIAPCCWSTEELFACEECREGLIARLNHYVNLRTTVDKQRATEAESTLATETKRADDAEKELREMCSFIKYFVESMHRGGLYIAKHERAQWNAAAAILDRLEAGDE